jgi:Zn-dependent M16 (insulinase) family peptidase
MNSAFSAIKTYFRCSMIRNILPHSSFHQYSGGVPSDLPSLTLNHFRRDCRDFYHADNALFLPYGSFPVGNVIEKVAEPK